MRLFRLEPTTKELDVVILADSDLMEFPFESMDFLTDRRICSVSRDFSLQVLYKRMKAHIAEPPSGKFRNAKNVMLLREKKRVAEMCCKPKKKFGPVRESNPGPLAPEARIIPLDQQADAQILCILVIYILNFTDAGATSEKRRGSEKKIVMQPSTITADVSNIKCEAFISCLLNLFFFLDVIDPSNECQFSAYNESE